MTAVDLHLHTTFSDGRLTPTQLVRMCAKRDLSVISISDHDSTEAIPEALEAARLFPDLTIIPGLELSTDIPGSEIHVLGYFVDYRNPHLQSVLHRFRDGRYERAREMLNRLRDLGVEIAWERIEELAAGGAVGRPHIAQAMVEAGYVQYPRDAFDQYLGRNGLAYVERPKLTPQDAVKLLVENGAVPVMAHPTYSASKSDRGGVSSLRRILQELKEVGLAGMEVYYGDYTPEQVECLEGLAKQLNLIPCGGSDYHASGNPGEPEPGSVGPPLDTVDDLWSIWRQNNSNA